MIFCSKMHKIFETLLFCVALQTLATKLWLDRLVYGTIILLALDMSLEESLLFFERGGKLAGVCVSSRKKKKRKKSWNC